ncbi:hypothetical protein BV25DRAFT_1868638 [Artomyces pyxidatus]|uniref:Uncharacterized protein n=1 Tax=Artomyces pyxidatus TaxID=48021 RepID=A0ACB8TAK3_9AGAM|nr:hypothetical protein BV25DRAFT_1868638 [Artomyces pyxidatus]
MPTSPSPHRPSPRSPYRTSSDFCFEDGNLTLCVGQFEFRIHRGLLGRHSDVFWDMLSIQQPMLHDSDPSRVILHDNPEDVHYLLHALYDGLYFNKPFHKDFPFLAATLRLSCKYFITIPKRRCLSRLLQYFPTTLAEWDRRELASTDSTGRYCPRDNLPSPILVINLARSLHLESFLPAAFYDLCRYGTSKTVVGTPPFPSLSFYSGGAPAPSESNGNAPSSAHCSKNVHLSHNDLVLTFRGRESGQRALSRFVEGYIAPREPSPTCLNKNIGAGQCCREAFHLVMINTLRSVGGIASGRDADPLYTLAQMVEMMHRTDWIDGDTQHGLRICLPCKADFAGAVNAGREETWRQIPGWFDLDDYQALLRRDEDVQQDRPLMSAVV